MSELLVQYPGADVCAGRAAVRCTHCGGAPQACIVFSSASSLHPLALCLGRCWPAFLEVVRSATGSRPPEQEPLERIARALEAIARQKKAML